MRFLMVRFGWSLIFGILLISCEDAGSSGKTDPCENVICEEWESCAAGECVLQEGRCKNYTHCTDDMFCDDALHTCRGPRQPPADFLDDLDGDSVAFSFAGIINPDTAVDPTLGTGDYAFDIEDLDGVLDEYAYALHYTFPEDYADTDLAGLSALFLGVSKIHHQSGSELDYHHFSWIVAKSLLQEIRDGDDPLMEAPQFIRFRLMDVNQYVRAWDQTLFRKYCTISTHDEADVRGRFFLDYFDNTTFEAGEDLRLWGNLPLTPRVWITPENEEANCLYRIGEEYVTRDVFEAERASTEPTLSCGIPDGFFGAPTPMHLEYFFSGELNPETATLATVVNGYADATAMLQDEVVLDDYSSLAMYITTGTAEPVDYAQSIGGVEMFSDDHYSFYLTGITIHTSTLAAMKVDQTDVIPWDSNHMLVTIEHHEERVVGEDSYSKICPAAVTDADTTGDLLACTGNNTDFTPGETLELALRVELTSEAAAIAAAYGYADGQACHCRFNSGTIDCAVFDALGTGR